MFVGGEFFDVFLGCELLGCDVVIGIVEVLIELADVDCCGWLVVLIGWWCCGVVHGWCAGGGSFCKG